MEDKIIKIEEEIGVVTLNLVDGSKTPIKAKTTYTHWQSGRKDCHVSMEKPLSMSGITK